MTVFVDVSGMTGLGLPCYGGEEERLAALEGRDPPVSNFKPKVNNVAPRDTQWQKSRNNTQQPPRTGPDSFVRPEAVEERGPMFGRPINKFTAY